jgi:RimJ/RimL family protein N-acetyltransferase
VVSTGSTDESRVTRTTSLDRLLVMPAVPTLTDGTVTLRSHREDDIEGAFEQSRDPLSQQWTTVPVPYTRDHARAFVTERMPRGWEDGSSWAFAVEVEGRYAGTVELRDEGEGRAEVAYGSHPWARGRGLMERAVRLLVDWGFASQGVEVMVWRANRGNWASRRLAWRLGFTVEGTVRKALPQRGQLLDAWVGTLLATDHREPKGRWLDVPVLEADGLRLRPWRDADVPRIVEACRDERTQHWLGRMPDPYQEADARAWLEHQNENRATGQGVQWAVVEPEDDRALAAIGYFDLVPEVELEIGYWAHPDARGRGVVSRAMAEVVRYAFDDLGVRRVTAGAASGNAASRHVIEANGLRSWGTERLGIAVREGRADVVWYDLLVEEWRASRHARAATS